jgi:RecA/RadA recombinase
VEEQKQELQRLLEILNLQNLRHEILKKDPSVLLLLTKNEIQSLISTPLSPQLKKEMKIILDNLKKNQNLSNPKVRSSKPNNWILPSSSLNFNSLLASEGFEAKTLTLIYGKARTGKTQFVYSLCVEAFKKLKDSPDIPKKVYYIDTENTFRPDRIIQMANYHKLDSNLVLKSIEVLSSSDQTEFQRGLNQLQEIMVNSPPILIVIDSFTKIFRLELSQDPENYNTAIHKLSETLKQLERIAHKFDVPIICTSQVTATFEKSYFFDVIPILSTTLNIYIKNWFLFAVDEQNQEIAIGRRFIHLINGEEKKEGIIRFRITENGIEDDFG